MLDNVDDDLKVIVVGDGNVGKTSMLRRFCKNDFTEQYKKTIGAEFMEKEVFIQETGSTVRLMLWDTAGQEIFGALTAQYYRGAAAAILAFSTSDLDSFHNVAKWKAKVEAQCGTIVMIVCQTKIDIATEAAKTGQQHVSPAEGEAMARSLGLPYFQISTKTNFNVTNLFEAAASRAITGRNNSNNAEAAAVAARSDGDKKEKKDKKDKDKKDKDKKDKDSKGADDGAPPQGGMKVNLGDNAAKGTPANRQPKKSGGGCSTV